MQNCGVAARRSFIWDLVHRQSLGGRQAARGLGFGSAAGGRDEGPPVNKNSAPSVTQGKLTRGRTSPIFSRFFLKKALTGRNGSYILMNKATWAEYVLFVRAAQRSLE